MKIILRGLHKCQLNQVVKNVLILNHSVLNLKKKIAYRIYFLKRKHYANNQFSLAVYNPILCLTYSIAVDEEFHPVKSGACGYYVKRV